MTDFLWVDGGSGGVPAHVTGLSEEQRKITERRRTEGFHSLILRGFDLYPIPLFHPELLRVD